MVCMRAAKQHLNMYQAGTELAWQNLQECMSQREFPPPMLSLHLSLLHPRLQCNSIQLSTSLWVQRCQFRHSKSPQDTRDSRLPSSYPGS